MDRRPLLATAATAVVSVGLLAAAIRFGWLGPDVGRGAQFCEDARSGLIKQPANTLSNAGFVVAGLAIAFYASRPRPAQVMGLPLATTYACVVALLGPASAAMHATQSAWGGHLDMLSMYLVAGFAAAYALTRLTRGGPGTFAVTYVVSLALCELAGLWTRPVPLVGYAGNVAFALLLLAAVLGEALLWRRGDAERTPTYGVAGLLTLLIAFGIWIAANNGLCDPHSLLQGHAAWHLLDAVAAYLLYRLYASERAPGGQLPGSSIHSA